MPPRATLSVFVWLSFSIPPDDGSDATEVCKPSWDGPYRGQSLHGCVQGDDCTSYASQDQAERVCVAAGIKCGGITYDSGYWQVRSCSTPAGSSFDEESHVKVFCEGTYIVTSAETDCPSGYAVIADAAECKVAAQAMGLQWKSVGSYSNMQGCFQYEQGDPSVWFNADPYADKTHENNLRICKAADPTVMTLYEDVRCCGISLTFTVSNFSNGGARGAGWEWCEGESSPFPFKPGSLKVKLGYQVAVYETSQCPGGKYVGATSGPSLNYTGFPKGPALNDCVPLNGSAFGLITYSKAKTELQDEDGKAMANVPLLLMCKPKDEDFECDCMLMNECPATRNLVMELDDWQTPIDELMEYAVLCKKCKCCEDLMQLPRPCRTHGECLSGNCAAGSCSPALKSMELCRGDIPCGPGLSCGYPLYEYGSDGNVSRCLRCHSKCSSDGDCVFKECQDCSICKRSQAGEDCSEHMHCLTNFCWKEMVCLEKVALGEACFEDEHCREMGKNKAKNQNSVRCSAGNNSYKTCMRCNGACTDGSEFLPPTDPKLTVPSQYGDEMFIIVGILAVVIILGAMFALIWRKTKSCRLPPPAAAGLAASKIGAPILYEESENDIAEDNATGLAEEVTAFPHYWTNTKHIESCSAESTAFNQMVYVSRGHLPRFGELLAQTFRAKATQDRPCPKGTHPRTPGGCECVQVGGDPGLPEGYQVRRAIRVESSSMWRRYLRRRQEIEAKRPPPAERDAETFPGLDPPAQTNSFTHSHRDMFEPLASDQNEVYIWHGTHVRKALAITQDRFKIDMAGTTRGGTMYGPGAYFAESSTKADEYAMDEPGGYYEGVYALLLCRAYLGRFYYTTERNEKAHENIESGEFDSTLGDRLKSADTFREFVIYDADQLYPEYVVLYSRIEKGSTKEPDFSFHMEVPIYWRNCHTDPHTTSFHDHYIVRKTVVDTLQRLADNTSQSLDAKARVIKARRIENSTTWSKYITCKGRMRQQLQDTAGKKFAKPEEFISGVLTHEHLAHENMEEAISLDNLEESLNEYMVWHGTDREAAEAIAHDDFRIPWSSKQRHGQRFGVGVYFSDCLDKSLTYTMPESDGTRYVLLCRMLCGDPYYTEDELDKSAADQARQSSKNSVLANPTNNVHREFVALTEDQVYPEYILELRLDAHHPDKPASTRDGYCLDPVPLATGGLDLSDLDLWQA